MSPKLPMIMLSVRVPRRLRDEANAVAAEREENISDVVRKELERYVKRHGRAKDTPN